MIRILFICHGNICRSPAAEIVLREMCRAAGIGAEVSSAATTDEEIGNGLYPPMRRALAGAGYPLPEHHARRTMRDDYRLYDRIIGMDEENMDDLLRVYRGDPEGKLSLLMSWAGEAGEVSDPWYTRDFSGALADIERGCRGIVRFLSGHRGGG
ncbi:MAG: low molecular weight phosphotyrosine protein phosphatase [Clostridia bacterium]|nr:low molecular weight phosphotyrosine protein phosphatase [Clostridia bacterium]